MKLQPLPDYHAQLYRRYTRPPSLETLRRKCKAGKIPAVQEDGRWYVLSDEVDTPTGDDVVDKILGIGP